MIIWAFFVGVGAVTGGPRTDLLLTLPVYVGNLWAATMVLAGTTVVVALVRRSDLIISAAMYLFATALAAYSVAIFGASGWVQGGGTAGLLLILGGVCFLRGWWLKEDDAVLTRSRRKESR